MCVYMETDNGVLFINNLGKALKMDHFSNYKKTKKLKKDKKKVSLLRTRKKKKNGKNKNVGTGCGGREKG